MTTNNGVYTKLGNSNVVNLSQDTIYAHPSNKVCNYNYTHPSTIQCNVSSEISSLKSSVSNGKNLIANAITGKGVATSSSDTFATMASNINKLLTGGINLSFSSTSSVSASAATGNMTVDISDWKAFCVGGGYSGRNVTDGIVFVYDVVNRVGIYAEYYVGTSNHATVKMYTGDFNSILGTTLTGSQLTVLGTSSTSWNSVYYTT